MTTKKSTNELQKKTEELKGKLGLLAERKREQQKTTTKQKLKNLRKSESPKKTSKQCKKSSGEKKISKGDKNDPARRGKSCSVDRTTGGNAKTLEKKKNKVKNQLADQEIFENSKFEISNYHSTGISASATHTPLEVSLIKKGDGVNLEQLNDTAEKKLKNKCEKEDEDDTLFNVDPLMPDMDLPSLRLNTKTE
ncbi:hypothetical protein ACH3XW_21045 [Acanthocheilonema viteae]